MKKIIALAIMVFLATGAAFAQHQHGHGCGNCPNHAQHHGQQAQQQKPQVNADGIDMAVVRAFPTVKSVDKTDKNGYRPVLDAQDKVLGYVVYSKPASDGIKGYAGETPVVVAFDTKKVIVGVYLLPNQETPKFARRVEEAGFYKNWNGLTAKKALKKEVDAVTGATFTSMAVANSVRAALETLK